MSGKCITKVGAGILRHHKNLCSQLCSHFCSHLWQSKFETFVRINFETRFKLTYTKEPKNRFLIWHKFRSPKTFTTRSFCKWCTIKGLSILYLQQNNFGLSWAYWQIKRIKIIELHTAYSVSKLVVSGDTHVKHEQKVRWKPSTPKTSTKTPMQTFESSGNVSMKCSRTFSIAFLQCMNGWSRMRKASRSQIMKTVSMPKFLCREQVHSYLLLIPLWFWSLRLELSTWQTFAGTNFSSSVLTKHFVELCTNTTSSGLLR